MVSPILNWIAPPPTLDLADHDVHLWLVDLDISAVTLQALEYTLSADEKARAKRFRFERDRKHFIACRAMLRSILGRYLACPPSCVPFSYGQYGKPRIDIDTSIQFNLSHSGGLAIYAIAHHAIGIDLEHYRQLEVEPVAKTVFSSQEYAALVALEPDEQLKAFFQLWTCKEAYLKATGEGLPGLAKITAIFNQRTAKFEFDQATQQVPVVLNTPSHWSIWSFSPKLNWVAALATALPDWHLRCYTASILEECRALLNPDMKFF